MKKLPEFELKNQDGELVNSQSWLGNPVVVYFYPKDDTPGCTAQACSFRDSFDEFKDLGVNVVGISADSPASHAKFAQKYQLPFTLLSDEKNEVRKQFGVPKSFLGLLPGRVTYVFDAAGNLKHEFNSQLKAKQHMAEALASLK